MPTQLSYGDVIYLRVLSISDRWLSGGGAYRLTIESQSIKLPDGTVLTMLSLAK